MARKEKSLPQSFPKKAPKAPKGSRGSSMEPRPLRLVPATSSFDFLEGAFSSAERARKLGIAIVMFSLTVLTVLALYGLSGLLSKESAQDLLTQTQANNQAALNKLATIDSAGGLSAATIESHVSERQAALDTATKGEIDVVALTTAIRAAAPAGVDVTSLTFAEPEPAAGSSSDESGETDASATPAAGAMGTVTIVATVNSFALINTWAQNLAGIPGLEGVEPTWSGGGTAIATTVVANLNESAHLQRTSTAPEGHK